MSRKWGDALRGFTIDAERGVAIGEFSIDDLNSIASAFGYKDSFMKDCYDAIGELEKVRLAREERDRNAPQLIIVVAERR